MVIKTLDLDLVQKELDKYPFAEMRVSRVNSTTLSLENGNLNNSSVSESLTIGFRVFVDGSFGYASTNDSTRWMDTLHRAWKLARANTRPKKTGLSDEDSYEGKWVVRPRKSLGMDVDEKVKLLRKGYKRLDIPRAVKTVEILYSDKVVEKQFLNTEGACILQKYPRVRVSIRSYAKRGNVVSAYDSMGGLYGLEIFDVYPVWERFQKAVDLSSQLLRAKRVPQGKQTVVVDPDMAGVFAHEAVGHACEGDAVSSKTSVLHDKLGSRIGSELVTIIDDATLPRKHGSYGYDDEGVPGQRTVLIEKGILKAFMHSRISAYELGANSTGNARAQNPGFQPIVRMSNTFFDKGEHSFEEMIEDVKSGLYVLRMKGGVTDPTSGDFQFAAEHGYLIENGEITNLVRDIVLSGNFLEILHNVDAVGRDLSVDDIGTCGKAGQGVPVGDGGPHVRIRGVLVG